MVSAIQIAAYICEQARPYGFSNVKLQKLVYFADAWSLGWTGRPLTLDRFEAWVNGPVERELWKTQRYSILPSYDGSLSEEARNIIDSVFAAYGDKPEPELVKLSHEEAWIEARAGLPDGVSGRSSLNTVTIRNLYARMAVQGLGPKRKASVGTAPSAQVERAATEVTDRWRDALDILASR
jgi:uncharacterized phage-associated protein